MGIAVVRARRALKKSDAGVGHGFTEGKPARAMQFDLASPILTAAAGRAKILHSELTKRGKYTL